MNRTTYALIAAACAAVAIMLYAATFVFIAMSDDEQYFGLTSTKATLLEGEELDLTVWSLPGDTKYTDIKWLSEDESVATVSAGTVTAQRIGKTEISATVNYSGKHYSQSCWITVSDTKDTQMLAYDAYSDDMDYAALSGDGFEKGYLSLTFNDAGNTVISLSGYDKSWLNLKDTFIGCAKTDFDSVNMVVYRGDSVVAEATCQAYSTNSADLAYEGSNSDAYSPLISVDKLEKGEYKVVFTLKYGMNVKKVQGTFSICEGDGLRDATGTYCVTYAWRCDATDIVGSNVRSFTAEYDYADYFDYYILNSKSISKNKLGIINCGYIEKSPRYVTQSSSLSHLADLLKADYTSAYGSSDYTTQHFSQYLLTFVQTQYSYEYDNVQYYKYEEKYSSSTDYWAYTDETLYSGAGDCEDTSFLLSSIFKELGFKTALIELPSHMMCAVGLENFKDYTDYTASARICKATKDGVSYYFCETTTDSPIIMKSTTTVTKITTKYYLTTLSAEKKSTLAETYYYGYYLVGNAPSSVGTEFSIIFV